ncbi:Uncharacterised protein [Listeria grayi]|uniref:Serine protease n=1 Tax=Listeria grayi FSL F6-1183 TaxID=1265827 RepID=A0A829R5L8_LISGR|nr:serine protease [Listeria grayi]EUJ27711.1 hypothetical protein LMUR_09284 [Listeria grayi FSL F6-1183]VEI34926.1 Uncharacterised protein [Listeria grayi]
MSTQHLTLAEQIIITTIRIETTIPNGISTGTGFFFRFKENFETGMHVPAIVTNKHVIENAITGKLRFSIADKDGHQVKGKYFDLVVKNFESLWIKHPEDDIDLCMLPIANIHAQIRQSGHELYYISLNSSLIPSSSDYETNFSRIEEITVVGYPDGIWDSLNNNPIVRKGITATPLQNDFENSPRFLIDSAIFGGSSGSPVFVFNQGSYSLPNGTVSIASRLNLVGIVYAVAQHSVSGKLEIVEIPASRTQVTHTLIPNNLGVTIHARKLLDFEQLLD